MALCPPIFRAKLRDALKKAGLFTQVDPRVWKKKWVVDCEAVGSGVAAFKYLAPYIFRVALSNNRLRSLENGNVTFSYKESATSKVKSCTLPAEKFISRFLQHVLPPRFIKVRYYGLLSPSHRHLLAQARQLLAPTSLPALAAGPRATAPTPLAPAPLAAALRCPNCGAQLRLLQTLKPQRPRPP